MAISFLVLQVALMVFSFKRARFSGMWFPIVQTLPFVFYFISMTYSQNTGYGNRLLETTMLMYILPWVYYFSRGNISAHFVQRVMRIFSWLMATFSLYAIGGLIVTGTLQEAYNTTDAYYFIRTKMEFLTGLHPTYFSAIISLALLIFQYGFREKSWAASSKFFAVVSMLVIAAALLLASSRMVLIATVLSSLVLWSGGQSRSALMRIFVFVALGATVAIVLIKPLRERVETLVSAVTNPGIEEHNPDSMRKAIFMCTTEAIRENWLWGVGLGDQQDVLNEKYEHYGFQLARERQFNTHNQYLQFWLAGGIFAFLAIVLLQVLQLLIAIAAKNRLHLAIVILFSMVLLTENFLSRQDGVFTYILFSTVFVYYSWSTMQDVVFLNGKFYNQALSGVQRFGREITAALAKLNPRLVILLPEKAETPCQKIVLPTSHNLFFEQWLLPNYLRLLGSPLLVNLSNSAPVLYRNQFVTIHDVAFAVEPKWYAKKFVKWYNFMIPKVVRNNKKLFTVSNFSRQEIARHFAIPPKSIDILSNGEANMKREETGGQKPLVSGNYALMVGSITPRKNQQSAIEVFLEQSIPDLKLVLAGSFEARVFPNQDKLMKRLNQAENIIHIESPSNADLASLYAHCTFTMYLSYYEGFGIPILESMAFKKAALVSEIPVFRELFEDAVFYTELDNYDNLRAQISAVFNSPEKREELIEKSQSILEKYSFSRSASALNEAIEKAGK